MVAAARITSRKRGFLILASLIAALAALGGCTLAPTLYSQQQMAQLGDQAYSKLKQDTPVSHNEALNRYVQCVVSNLAAQTPRKNWNVTVFQSKEANAFALPGGNIGVYTGILKYADTQAQLAAVIGHEMGHVLSHDVNQRMSRAAIARIGMQALGSAIGGSGAEHQQVMALLGLGTQVGVMMPFSRSQEARADLIGQSLMAKAGFDPESSIRLWQNMSRAGSRPPEFLSDHPSPSHRIANLKSHMPQAMREFKAARAAGRHPRCGATG